MACCFSSPCLYRPYLAIWLPAPAGTGDTPSAPAAGWLTVSLPAIVRVVFLGSSGLFHAGSSQPLGVSHCPLSLAQDSCPIAGSYVVTEADFNPFMTCPGSSGPSLHQPQEAALSLKLVSDILIPTYWLMCFSSGNRAPSSWSTLPDTAFCLGDSSGAIYRKRFSWTWDLGVPGMPGLHAHV